MQFSDTSTKNGIVEEIDFFCGTDSTSYPTADKVRNVNNHYYRAGLLLWKNSPNWRWDDSNHTGISAPTLTLVNAQEDYTLPTTIIGIDRIEVEDSAGIWHEVQRINELDIPGAVQEFGETDGIPRYWYMKGEGTLILKPAPSTSDVTLTNGLKLHLGRLVDPFTSSDTTQTPGFNASFHRILSYGGSEDWYETKDAEMADRYALKRQALEKDMIDFYSGRQGLKKTIRTRRYNNE